MSRLDSLIVPMLQALNCMECCLQAHPEASHIEGLCQGWHDAVLTCNSGSAAYARSLAVGSSFVPASLDTCEQHSRCHTTQCILCAALQAVLLMYQLYSASRVYHVVAGEDDRKKFSPSPERDTADADHQVRPTHSQLHLHYTLQTLSLHILRDTLHYPTYLTTNCFLVQL